MFKKSFGNFGEIQTKRLESLERWRLSRINPGKFSIIWLFHPSHHQSKDGKKSKIQFVFFNISSVVWKFIEISLWSEWLLSIFTMGGRYLRVFPVVFMVTRLPIDRAVWEMKK